MNPTIWKIHTSSPETWEDMLLACENATESIDMSQFLFVADEVGKRFIDVFTRKAKEGVKVRLMWDAAGSFSFYGSEITENLKKKGIEFILFKSLLPEFLSFFNFRAWYFRNHHRTLLVDGKIGFTGSICISKEMEAWRETHVKIEGHVVKDMGEAFEHTWKHAHRKRIHAVQQKNIENSEFKYITNTPLPRRRYLYNEILGAMSKARRSIYITVPYFVPTKRLLHSLRSAARRGVDVKIIITERSDHPLVDLAARTYFHYLLNAGIKIFLYQEKMLHTKTITIDGIWSTVGTMNLDHVSLLYNFEANLVSTNSWFTGELITHFNHDLTQCKEITLKDWNERYFFEKTASFFVRFLRIFF